MAIEQVFAVDADRKFTRGQGEPRRTSQESSRELGCDAEEGAGGIGAYPEVSLTKTEVYVVGVPEIVSLESFVARLVPAGQGTHRVHYGCDRLTDLQTKG